MNLYQQEYQRKRIDLDQLLDMFRSDLFVVLGSGPVGPVALLDRLHELHGKVSHLHTSTALPLKAYPVMVDPQYADILDQESSFFGPAQRVSAKIGRCDHMPSHLRKLEQTAFRFREDPDLVVVAASPMDKHGYFTFPGGTIADREAVRRGKKVILEVCSKAPRTLGDNLIHISQVAHVVEVDRGLPEFPVPPMDDADLAIGRLVADLVEDGATIQLGIGAIPNAVAKFLMDKKDLGMHTELLVDSTVDLVEAGVLTGRRKTLYPGQILTVLTLGTQRLYDFIDDNQMVLHRSAEYNNDPYVIAQNYKMTSINTTLQVDLFGQCASEAVGGSQISGIGGQLETGMGAQMAPGGKAIMTLHSTGVVKQPDGSKKLVSKIVPGLTPGTIVSTPRSDVQFVVTEFGAADLRGMTVSERAKALIELAHPDFRAELTEAAGKMRIL